tara:strand:+ start:2714 stop:3181 length:468 start_codon:yes stop_codon:yes gene_type:complete
MRVGNGFDIHRLESGSPLIIGGVRIPWTQRLSGHSDADVLIHAVCDALLGAIGYGDLGTLFPETDNVNQDRDSREFLSAVFFKLNELNIEIQNIDCTIVAQRPRLSGYFPEMKLNISKDLMIPDSKVHIKAKTSDAIGVIGREEGIAAFVVALVE